MARQDRPGQLVRKQCELGQACEQRLGCQEIHWATKEGRAWHSEAKLLGGLGGVDLSRACAQRALCHGGCIDRGRQGCADGLACFVHTGQLSDL